MSHIKRFHSILLYASDLEKSTDFYKKIGFDVEKVEDSLLVRLANFEITLIDENMTPIKNDSGSKPKGLGVFIYIEVDDVDEYFKSLKESGTKTSSEPRNWPWGKREFAVKDPDGYKLIFFHNL